MKILRFIASLFLAASLAVAQQPQTSTSSQPSPSTTQSQPSSAQQAPPEQKSVPGIGVTVQEQSKAPTAGQEQGAKPQKPQDTEVGPGKGQVQQEEPEEKITPAQAEELFRSIDEIIAFDSKATGLPQKHTVKKQLSSRDEVQRFIETRMKEDKDAKRLERSELVLKKLGLLPRDFQLRPFLIALLKEQVAGYYDSKTKTVYLLDWLGPEAQKPVMAHELTHALQDQNFDLEKFTKQAEKKKDLDSDERLVARQSVEEGQAMIALLDYVLAPVGKDVQSDPAAVEAMMAAMRSGGSTPKLAEAPAYLRDVLIFPYNWGTDFVRTVLVKRGKEAAFAGLFRDPPRDTREVMEPEVYLAGQHLPPTKAPDFDKMLGNGYKKYDLSGLGEFDVWEIAKQFGSEDGAKNVANGFRGAYSYVATKGGADPKTTADMSLVLVTHWGAPEMAQRFAKMWGISVQQRYAGASANGDGAWTTPEGPVNVETRGDTVLVSEGFDAASVAKLKVAVFEGRE
jgi:hypothetical protein